MRTYKRNSISDDLDKYDVLAKKDDFIEVTSWSNGEGFDVTIESPFSSHFQLTYGAFDAIKKLLKKLEKEQRKKWKKK